MIVSDPAFPTTVVPIQKTQTDEVLKKSGDPEAAALVSQ
jgi:hypothetical protein